MSKKITKLKDPPTPPVCEENSLGLSPAVLGKRGLPKTEDWCPKPNPLLIYFDPACDPYNPKALQYKDVHKAYEFVKKKIPKSPLMKSNGCAEFDMHLYFKTESLQKTGSFHDRSARYALEMLSTEQRRDGVYTSSLGNWGMALAYHAHKLGIPVTVVYPTSCLLDTVQKCKDYGAHVVKFGTYLTEAHREALNIIKEKGVGTYINGYDNPHVIAADGTIGIEVVEQLPDVDAILIPIGGGGLIAGIATAVKKLKPTTLIKQNGVESNNCCCFFKALDNEKPYAIDMCAERGMPIAGYNAFHTAQSLIDKVILVKDDWIAEATLHFVEEERLIVERRAATALAPLFSEPHVVPELRNKKYV